MKYRIVTKDKTYIVKANISFRGFWSRTTHFYLWFQWVASIDDVEEIFVEQES